MAYQTGQTCYFYRNTGTFGSPTWVLIDNVENLKAPDSRTKAPAPTRASKFNKYLAGMIEQGVTLNMPRNVADADYLALRSVYLAGNSIGIAHASGPIATTGSRYNQMDAKIFKMDEDEPLDGAAMVDVEFGVAADSTNDPSEAVTA